MPARVSGRHVERGRQSSPVLEVRLGEQARLVKTVKIQEVGRQLILDKTVGSRMCGDTSKAFASSCSIQAGAHTSGSGIAVDWVTGRSYLLEEGRRLNVQSGLRKG